MVEVTRTNFSDLFPTIEKCIKNSTFIAIDTEFTGLSLGPSNENNLFDALPKRYEKLKNRATSFVPCQIGLSTFTKVSDKNSYSVETFVFYIRPCMVGSVDRVFTCQASAMDFLTAYNFDFKKFLSEGIPYINENEEVQVRHELDDGTLSLPHEKMQDQRYQAKINDIIDKKFKKYINSKQGKASTEEVTFPIDRKSHAYFQVMEIRRKFPKLWAYEKNDMIVVKMISSHERKKLVEYEAVEQERVLEYFLGFTRVFKVLKESQKPIVGHNFLMDLMLFYHNFYRNLPDTYDEFKKELHCVFPVVYDTKHIWRNIRQVLEFKRFASCSTLSALFELFKRPPDYLNTLFSPSIIPYNCRQYIDEEFVHDSGYDAFITGFVFLKICHLLAMEKASLLIPKDKPPAFKHLLMAASPFVNKVNFPFFKFKYMNLEGADPLPEKMNYLCISPKNRTRTLSLEELNLCLSQYRVGELKFINQQRAAVVIVQNMNIYKKILRDFKDDPDLIVEEYDFLRHSPFVNATLWLTAVTSGCLIAAWIWKYL